MTEARASEMSVSAIIRPHLPALAQLCRRFGVRQLDLFGSAATGRFDPAVSDLDFLVEFEPEARGNSYFGLLAGLERLFQRKIDLLTEPGLENPYLRRRIEAERQTLFPVAMISNQAATFLWEARRAAERITRFKTGRSYDDYLDDDMLRAAVERQFEIIGEAFVGLRRADPALAAQLPDLPQIIAFRNVLIHGYATINHRIVWDAVNDDLPRLVAALTQLLGTTPDP